MEQDRPSKREVRALVGEQVAEQYARGVGEVDPSPGLDRLHELLVHAAQEYEAGPEKQRQAICDSIIAITDLLKDQGFSGATLLPLNRVLRSIVELNGLNRTDPLFCEKPKRTKPRRSMEDAIRQGHLAALADAWIISRTSDEGDESAKLERAARRMSGAYFGKLDGAKLISAKSYQRQMGQHDLVGLAFEQMKKALSAQANSSGDGASGLRNALEVQIDALNERAKLRKS